MSDIKIPVFRISPRNRSNDVMIKYVGTVHDSEKLGDEIVELDRPIHHDHDVYGRHSIPIKRIGEYEIVGRIYRCNIIADHLIKQNTYPYIYLNVGYDRALVSGSLLQLYLTFEMDMNEKKKITTPQQYIERTVGGRWRLQIDCEESMLQNYDKLLRKNFEDQMIREFVNKQIIEDSAITQTITPTITQTITRMVNEKMDRINKWIRGDNFIFSTKDGARDGLIELAQSDDFYQLLVVAMKCRELTRRKESHLDDDSQYIVPLKITRMCNLADELVDSNEFIGD